MSKPSTRDAPRSAAANEKPPQLQATSSTPRPSRLPPNTSSSAVSSWTGLRRSSSCRSSAAPIGLPAASPCIVRILDARGGISSVQDEHGHERSAILQLDRQRRGGGTTSDIFDGLSLLGSDGDDAHLLRLGDLALAAVHGLHRHLPAA